MELYFRRIHYQIIDYLNKCPFTSAAIIAAVLNYDRSTVSKRLKELRTSGVLGTYSTYIKSETLGFPICAYLYLDQVTSRQQLLQLFAGDSHTIMIERTGDTSYIVSMYLRTCEQAYNYRQKCSAFCAARLQIILHQVQSAHPVYPPYLFKGADDLPYDPVGWRRRVPWPNNNLSNLSNEELKFFKLVSTRSLPYDLRDFCKEQNLDIDFASNTIQKLIQLKIIYGFDLQINPEKLGLPRCEHVCIDHPSPTAIAAIDKNQNVKLANLMADGSLLVILHGRDKQHMDQQLAQIAPLDEMVRYQVQEWVMYPRNVLP